MGALVVRIDFQQPVGVEETIDLGQGDLVGERIDIEIEEIAIPPLHLDEPATFALSLEPTVKLGHLLDGHESIRVSMQQQEWRTVTRKVFAGRNLSRLRSIRAGREAGLFLGEVVEGADQHRGGDGGLRRFEPRLSRQQRCPESDQRREVRPRSGADQGDPPGIEVQFLSMPAEVTHGRTHVHQRIDRTPGGI